MKILVLSREPWNISNSFGNTFENIFSSLSNVDIANIYCSDGDPNTAIVEKFFEIDEKRLIDNLFNKNSKSWREFELVNSTGVKDYTDGKLFQRVSKYKCELLYCLRELIWKVGRWKSKELVLFIKNFQPDIIYIPVYEQIYMIEIGLFIKKVSKKPMICHITDDIYSYRPRCYSPLYKIRKFFIRRKIKKIISQCEFIDTFTFLQKKVYEKWFHKECKIRLKSASLCKRRKMYSIECYENKKMKILYTGNIGGGRWCTIKKLANVLEKINLNGKINYEIEVYSANMLTNDMKKDIVDNKCLKFMGRVSGDKIRKIQCEADILLFTESLEKNDSRLAWLSLSTKIIDYLSLGLPILAIGRGDIASIKYLEENNAALIASKEIEIEGIFNSINKDIDILNFVSENALNCAIKNHDKSKLGKLFQNDLNKLYQYDK